MAKKKNAEPTSSEGINLDDVVIAVENIKGRLQALETNAEVEDLKDRINALEYQFSALSKRLDTLF